MSTNAQRLARVNVAIIIICSILLIVCVARQLWLPALVNAAFVGTNAFQLVTSRTRP